jgi:hypothetical protein
MIIERDELYNTTDEIIILKRLLQEAIWRRRIILKKTQLQGWWDWVLEFVGY